MGTELTTTFAKERIFWFQGLPEREILTAVTFSFGSKPLQSLVCVSPFAAPLTALPQFNHWPFDV